MGSPDCYPGADARADEVIRLANHYRGAANDLLRLVEEKGARRIAPCRLCAVHAIELYLNAFLLKLGHPPERIRDSGHDLAARAALASAGGLALRRRTAIHLATMTLGPRVPRPALRPGHGRGGAAQPALGHPRRDRPQGHERGEARRAERGRAPRMPGPRLAANGQRARRRGSERSGGAGPGPLGQVEIVVLLHEGVGEPLALARRGRRGRRGGRRRSPSPPSPSAGRRWRPLPRPARRRRRPASRRRRARFPPRRALPAPAPRAPRSGRDPPARPRWGRSRGRSGAGSSGRPSEVP